MIRRIGLAVLWLFATWSAAAMAAYALGLATWIVPGAAIAAAIAIFWASGQRRHPEASANHPVAAAMVSLEP